MQNNKPLKTLIFYSDKTEIAALLNFTQKHSSLFWVLSPCRDLYNLHLVLSTESFDLTFFDETSFPYTLIDRFKNEMGVVVFKNKETISWKLSLETKKNGFLQFNPMAIESQRRFLNAIKNKTYLNPFEKDRLDEQNNIRLTFKDGHRQVSLCLKDIVYIEVNDKLSKIYFEQDGKMDSITQWDGLVEFAKLFNSNIFFKSHRKHLINLRYFKEVCYNTKSITLTKMINNEAIVLKASTRRLRVLKSVLKIYKCALAS